MIDTRPSLISVRSYTAALYALTQRRSMATYIPSMTSLRTMKAIEDTDVLGPDPSRVLPSSFTLKVDCGVPWVTSLCKERSPCLAHQMPSSRAHLIKGAMKGDDPGSLPRILLRLVLHAGFTTCNDLLPPRLAFLLVSPTCSCPVATATWEWV